MMINQVSNAVSNAVSSRAVTGRACLDSARARERAVMPAGLVS